MHAFIIAAFLAADLPPVDEAALFGDTDQVLDSASRAVSALGVR